MSILIVRLGSLGDLIHTLPAVAALREAFPREPIDWVVDEAHRDLLDLVPVISSVVPLRARTAGGWLEVRRELRRRRYRLALDFQGLMKSATLAWLSGAGDVVGFARAALREPGARIFYSRTVEVDDTAHVIRKNLALARAAGAATPAEPFEFPLRDVRSAALDTLRDRGVGRYALLNVGAAWPNKRWPPARFGELARWLLDAHALTPVVLWGPDEEGLAAEAVVASGGAARQAPPTSLHDVIALARGASLMVSGDTGPTHIAGAVGTPLVALFGPTDPHRNGPWVPDDRVVSRYGQCVCHYERRCRLDASQWCLSTITEPDVRAAIDERLRGSAAT